LLRELVARLSLNGVFEDRELNIVVEIVVPDEGLQVQQLLALQLWLRLRVKTIKTVAPK
jgi:hypothetical protein